jgi:hypothetical protein
VKFETVMSEKEKLQKLLSNGNKDEQEHHEFLQLKYRNYQMEQEIKDLKTKLHIPIDNSNNEQHQQRVSESSRNNNVDKSFQEQIPVSDDHYKIPINVRNRSSMSKVVMASDSLLSTNNNNNNNNHKEGSRNGGIINSVENFQIIAESNVLQQPVLINGKSSSTTTTTPTSVIKKNNNLALPKSKSQSTATTTKSSKKLPKFVLPIPPDIKTDDNEIPKESVKEDKKSALDETLNKPQNDDINEMENGAHEINDNDFNDFNIEEKRSHFEDNLEQDKNMINNAAEEFDAHKPVDKKNSGNNDEMDLEIINRPVKDKLNKLNEEIANDHGKEEAYLEDLHIEQQQEDDLGDSKLKGDNLIRLSFY